MCLLLVEDDREQARILAEARRADLSPEQVGAAVSGALLGVPAGEVRGDDRTVNVRVRAPDAVRFDAATLGALPVVAGPGSRVIPLAALASIRTVESRAEILRENQRQLIAMTGDVSGRSLGGVMRDVRRVLASHPAPQGIRVELGGQYAGQQQAFQALLIVLALAAVSVIGVMVVQFESFIEPLVVTLVAPVSFVGAIALLLVTGTPLNVSSLMGLILLVGLIVKNGIILLDFTRRRMRLDGLPLEPAIRDAARVRLRPILMTTLCTLFGLLPLALGLGVGSELQRPLALVRRPPMLRRRPGPPRRSPWWRPTASGRSPGSRSTPPQYWRWPGCRPGPSTRWNWNGRMAPSSGHWSRPH